MDDICKSKHGGRSNCGRVLLLLFLAEYFSPYSTALKGLQPVLSTDGETPEPGGPHLDCVIVGPDFVTVGVPSSIECTADCPSCTFSMSLDGQSAQGQGDVLAFTIDSWRENFTVSCTVTDDETLQTATATKKLKVLAGPANVSISGPNLMKPTVSHTYSCHAYCRPSCNYTWRMDKGAWIGGQGNVISINPREEDNYKTLACKATNSVSGLFVAATRNIAVASGPSEIQIKGPDVIEIAKKYTFECTSDCRPSCRYLSSVDSQTLRGSVIELTVEYPLKSLTIKCEAQNTASRKTATALKTVQLTASDHNPSTRPEETSAVLLLLLAFITYAAYAL